MTPLRTLATALGTSVVAAALLVGVGGAANGQDAGCGVAPGAAAVVTGGTAPEIGTACATTATGTGGDPAVAPAAGTAGGTSPVDGTGAGSGQAPDGTGAGNGQAPDGTGAGNGQAPDGTGAEGGQAPDGAAGARDGAAGARDGAWPDSRGAAALLAVALVTGALAVARLLPAGPAERVPRPRAGAGEGWRRASAPAGPNGATTGAVRPGSLTPTWR